MTIVALSRFMVKAQFLNPVRPEFPEIRMVVCDCNVKGADRNSQRLVTFVKMAKNKNRDIYPHIDYL